MKERVVVNGDDVFVEVLPRHTGMDVLREALRETENTGRRLEDWCLWDVSGNYLNLDKPLLGQEYSRPLLATLKFAGGLDTAKGR